MLSIFSPLRIGPNLRTLSKFVFKGLLELGEHKMFHGGLIRT